MKLQQVSQEMEKSKLVKRTVTTIFILNLIAILLATPTIILMKDSLPIQVPTLYLIILALVWIIGIPLIFYIHLRFLPLGKAFVAGNTKEIKRYLWLLSILLIAAIVFGIWKFRIEYVFAIILILVVGILYFLRLREVQKNQP